MADYDLIVRGGTVADGTGTGTRQADVAVKDGKIAAVGAVPGKGREEGVFIRPHRFKCGPHLFGRFE